MKTHFAQEGQPTNFGDNRDHNRHFVLISVVLLVGALGTLYLLNFFGIFLVSGNSGQLSEDKCMELFGIGSVGFNEFVDGDKTIKQGTLIDGPKISTMVIEEENENIKCSLRFRSNQTIFKSKGLGSGEYDCDNIHVTYAGRNENNYFALSKEFELSSSSNVTVDRPSNSGIPSLDKEYSKFPEKMSGEVVFDFGIDNFVVENVYTNNRTIFDNELNSLKDKNCPSLFDLLA
ncbi:MAG: hypothetical protein HY831_01225 [Candidatus Aenigmarchaeota archaeon]|nr:hypothetical protein [Candidatus Aenigmarchaeota archaeon]